MNILRRKRGSKAKKLVPKDLSFEGLPCDSQLEVDFANYLAELRSLGYVRSFRRPSSFQLSDEVSHTYIKPGKRKVSSIPAKETILEGCLYTPDFEVLFTEKSLGKIIVTGKETDKIKGKWISYKDTEKNLYRCIIEIKPTIDWGNKTTMFKYLQKWVMKDHSIFVNLVKVPDIFSKTFTPESYKKTPTGKDRKINWKVRSAKDYLQ